MSKMRKILPLVISTFVLVFAAGVTSAETIPQTREQRLDQAILAQSITLDDNQKIFVATRCNETKRLLQNLRIDTETSIRKRLDVYNDLQKDLQALNLRFARQAVDASELELLSGKLQQKLDEFTLQSDAYGTAIGDTIDVSCSTPERFKAGVVLTRAQFGLLSERAQELKESMQSANQYTYPQLKKRLTS